MAGEDQADVFGIVLLVIDGRNGAGVEVHAEA